jgi:hypothetical protein
MAPSYGDGAKAFSQSSSANRAESRQGNELTGTAASRDAFAVRERRISPGFEARLPDAYGGCAVVRGAGRHPLPGVASLRPSTIKYQMKIHGALGSARNAVQERRGECISMQSILTLPR